MHLPVQSLVSVLVRVPSRARAFASRPVPRWRGVVAGLLLGLLGPLGLSLPVLTDSLSETDRTASWVIPGDPATSSSDSTSCPSCPALRLPLLTGAGSGAALHAHL